MKVVPAQKEDFSAWLDLAKEVEHLFGPMSNEESFKSALISAIEEGHVFCIKENNSSLCGGIFIVPADNEIGWLAVSKGCRCQGAGTILLKYAIDHLDYTRPIKLVTFADTVLEGLSARKLYLKYGFTDHESMGKNPAGFPVVLMVRPQTNLP